MARIHDGDQVGRLLEMLALRTGELLNVSSLGCGLGIDRQTAERHLAVLEKLFLVRRLPAWHRNSAKRLVKTPKVHLCDSGLAATLAGLQPDDWIAERGRFGHLLESFVVQQLVAQAGWTDPDLRFHHYRDKDKVEVDCVITRGRKVWGLEIKTAASVRPIRRQGPAAARRPGGRQNYQGGALLYDGASVLRLDQNGHLAVPLRKLWEL